MFKLNHKEILKQKLFNYDYSNTPVNNMILVELNCLHITVETQSTNGFTHWKSSGGTFESLIEKMNYEVSKNPDYDLIIVDKNTK